MGAFTKGKNKITDSSTITGGPGIRREKIKKLLKFLSVLLIVATVGFAIYLLIGNDKSITNNKFCDEDMINRSIALINNDEINELSNVVNNEIMTNQDYKSDINCVYIIIRYNIAQGAVEEAKSLLQEYEKIYDVAGISLEQSSPDQLRALIEQKEKDQEQIINNTFFFDEVDQESQQGIPQ
ncbi:MAG: hypothetical protein M3P98_00810 [bacterium]|nr:hypothetical protein [bacterium]